MPMFELDAGRPAPVQPMQPAVGTFDTDSTSVLGEHLGSLLGEPLFPVARREPGAPDAPHLLAMDAAGQPVVVEVVQVLDPAALTRSLRLAGAAARMSSVDLARAYGPGPDRFAADLVAFRETVPVSAAHAAARHGGARLLLVCSEVAESVVDAVEFLRGPDRRIDVLQLGVVRGPDGRRFVEVSPLVARAPSRRPVEPSVVRVVTTGGGADTGDRATAPREQLAGATAPAGTFPSVLPVPVGGGSAPPTPDPVGRPAPDDTPTGPVEVVPAPSDDAVPAEPPPVEAEPDEAAPDEADAPGRPAEDAAGAPDEPAADEVGLPDEPAQDEVDPQEEHAPDDADLPDGPAPDGADLSDETTLEDADLRDESGPDDRSDAPGHPSSDEPEVPGRIVPDGEVPAPGEALPADVGVPDATAEEDEVGDAAGLHGATGDGAVAPTANTGEVGAKAESDTNTETAPGTQTGTDTEAGTDTRNGSETETETHAGADPTAAPPAAGRPEAVPALAALAERLGGTTTLVWTRLRRGQRFVATLRRDGLLQLADGTVHADPDAAATAVADAESSVDGWRAWHVGDGGPSLADAREA